MVTCDSSFNELIDAAFRAVKKKEMVSIRMIGDKRPYNFPLPIVRVKPAVKNTDTVQQYRPYMVVEYVEWARTPAAQAKIAKIEAMHARGNPETVSEDEPEDDLI